MTMTMGEAEAKARIVDSNGYTLIKKTHLFFSFVIIIIMIAVQVALFVYDRSENNFFRQTTETRLKQLEIDSGSRSNIILELRYNLISYLKQQGFDYIENPPELRK